MMRENRKNNIDGLIVLDKEKGYTSHDCLACIKKILNIDKVGHTGTLDVNASGVLVCLLGKATKAQEFLMQSGEKKYKAELILGLSTDTEDITGSTIYDIQIDKNIDKEMIESAANTFIGDYEQIPPMYSAKKVDGKKLINIARKGKVIDRKPSKVKIYDIKIGDMINKEHLHVDIEVTCSKGTYIRTLCKDLGEKLSVPACMGDLRRIKTSLYDIKDAITLNDIKNKVENGDFSFIKPCLYQKNDAVVTFGKFETLHLGHQLLINKVVDKAKEKKYESTVLSIGKNINNNVFTDEQKMSKLKYMGVDNVLNFPFNDWTKKIEAKEFVEEILINQLKAKIIVVGDDCRFGYNGIGDKNVLRSICIEKGIEIIIISKMKVKEVDDASIYKNEDISSTLIKDELKKNNLEFINKLLGR